MSAPLGRTDVAAELGYLVGRDVDPVTAAARHYLTLGDLVALRIDHWEEYDAGLIEGRRSKLLGVRAS